MRWNVVFFVFANESFALNAEADAPGAGFAPLFTCAAFSRSACSFAAFRLNPPTFTPLALGNRSLIVKSSHNPDVQVPQLATPPKLFRLFADTPITERLPQRIRAQANLAGKILFPAITLGENTMARTYTTEQLAIVARELREAAGADEPRFTSTQALELLDGEIRSLRQRGFTNERITEMLTSFDIELKPDAVDRRSRNPNNLLRRLLWDRAAQSQSADRYSPDYEFHRSRL